MFAFLVTVFPYFFQELQLRNPNALRHQIGNQGRLPVLRLVTGSPMATFSFVVIFMIGRIFLNYLQLWRNVWKKWKPRTLNRRIYGVHIYIYSRKKLPKLSGKMLHGASPISLEENKFLRFQTHCPKNRPKEHAIVGIFHPCSTESPSRQKAPDKEYH